VALAETTEKVDKHGIKAGATGKKEALAD